MILQEFIFMKEKSDKMAGDFGRLNNIRKKFKGKGNFYDDQIKPECKCKWQGEDCEDLCMHQHR